MTLKCSGHQGRPRVRLYSSRTAPPFTLEAVCFPSPRASLGPQPLPCARVPRPCAPVSGSGARSGCAMPPEPSVLQVSVSEQHQRWSLLAWVTPCGCILPAQSSDGQAGYCQTVGRRWSTMVFSHCSSCPGLQTPLCSENQALGEQGGWTPAFPARPMPTTGPVCLKPRERGRQEHGHSYKRDQ